MFPPMNLLLLVIAIIMFGCFFLMWYSAFLEDDRIEE